MTEHDDTEKRIGSVRASASRRRLLRGIAAGSAVGLGGLGGVQAQETTTDGEGTTPGDDEETTEGDQRQGFFEAGTEVGVQMVADGMTAPTDFAVADEDRDRYFVADQTGELYVVTDEGLQDEPFLDVSDRMLELGTFEGEYADPTGDYEERGLLGVEFHPDFAENGRFFVRYSAPPNDETPEDWSHVAVLSEFQATEDMESADPDSEEVLMEFQSPQYNHVAGPMAFGPDGYLYVPMGDGGGANDDMLGHVEDWYDENDGGNGQNTTENLLGGIHRIDVDSEGDDAPYGIPDDNPFVDSDEGLDEYYAWGFRNPFGVSFDSEGRFFVADAGQDVYEEANLVERGGNYGWNVKEGTHCFSTDSPSQHPDECPDRTPDDVRGGEELIDPIVEYPHVYDGESEGIVIVGGYFYEQDTVPNLGGKYIFGDWTKDPQREEPAGRLLAATDPGDDGAGGTETSPGGTETPEADETPDGTETTATPGGKETPAIEDEDGENGETETPEDGAGEDEVVPRDQLWDMEELVVAGSDDGTLDWFVRMFGQDADGEVYVLVNRRGVPEGDTGAVLRIVPPGEGDGSATADETVEGGGQETVEGEGETTTEADETATEPGEEATENDEVLTEDDDEVETTVEEDD